MWKTWAWQMIRMPTASGHKTTAHCGSSGRTFLQVGTAGDYRWLLVPGCPAEPLWNSRSRPARGRILSEPGWPAVISVRASLMLWPPCFSGTFGLLCCCARKRLGWSLNFYRIYNWTLLIYIAQCAMERSASLDRNMIKISRAAMKGRDLEGMCYASQVCHLFWALLCLGWTVKIWIIYSESYANSVWHWKTED